MSTEDTRDKAETAETIRILAFTVVPGLTLILAVILLCCCCCQRRRQPATKWQSNKPPEMEMTPQPSTLSALSERPGS